MRYAKKVDENQPKIVKELRKVPGLSVALDHDDILVGFRGATYWFEIKNPSRFKKDGTLQKGALKKSQRSLLNEFSGHYQVVSTSDEILKAIGAVK